MKKLKKSEHKKVVKHLKGDIEGYKHEAAEDRKLIKDLKKADRKVNYGKMVDYEKKERKAKEKMGKKRSDLKFDRVLTEFKGKKLHSGSKKGPVVKDPKQAVAIAYSESRRAYKGKKKK